MKIANTRRACKSLLEVRTRSTNISFHWWLSGNCSRCYSTSPPRDDIRILSLPWLHRQFIYSSVMNNCRQSGKACYIKGNKISITFLHTWTEIDCGQQNSFLILWYCKPRSLNVAGRIWCVLVLLHIVTGLKFHTWRDGSVSCFLLWLFHCRQTAPDTVEVLSISQ